MSEKISRRKFLQISSLGAAAAAVLTGCGPASRYVVRKPYANMPEYNQTGVSTYYATTCRECAAGCGLILRTFEGRAIKAEGNPQHPVNRGKLCPRGLTTVQGLSACVQGIEALGRGAVGVRSLQEWSAGVRAELAGQDAGHRQAPQALHVRRQPLQQVRRAPPNRPVATTLRAVVATRKPAARTAGTMAPRSAAA